MSTNQPPAGPPAGPPSGPPPSGPPPSGASWGPPPAAPPQTEVLSQGGGGPLPPQPPTGAGSGGGKGKWFLIGGGVIGALALGAGAVFAYSWLDGNGPQPAEALPADALGYVSIDLDPNGKQKIEAYNTLKKFPAAKEWLDEEGVNADSDLVEKLWNEVKDECDGDVSYEDDVKPWLGKRFAFAAVEGEDRPDPVGVVQVTDAGEAEKGVQKLRDECGGDDEDQGGVAFAGDWMVVAETQEIADDVVKGAEKGTLADDDTFQKWTGEAGDSGIVSAYLSDDAGAVIADQLGSLSDLGGLALDGMGGADSGLEPAPDDLTDEYLGDSDDSGSELGGPDDDSDLDDAQKEAIAKAFEDFGGGAMTVRFDDGSLEVEFAGDTAGSGVDKVASTDEAGAIVEGLPGDTAAAFALSFESGWAQQYLDLMGELSGGEFDPEEMLAQAEAELGISIPDDVETLLGEAAALSVGGDIDPESMTGMAGFTDIPVGVKVKGEADEVEGVLDKIRAKAPSPEEAEILGSDSEGDYVAVSPSEDYRKALLGDGGLGDDEIYQDVIREDGAGAVFFINFDAGDGWLEKLAENDEEAQENIAPLAGFGVTSWRDGDVGHGVLRLTTN